VRVALQALSAVLGGAQSLHTNSRDEALALPTEESVRLALRTQQIVAHETGVAATADPLGGSQYIEEQTDRIERGARAYIEKIDALGGALAAIECGYIQGEIQNSAYELQRQVESARRVVVGVNRFQADERQAAPTFRLDPALEREQVERLRALRASRDNAAVDAALDRLERAAAGSENLMPFLLEAADHYATVGEISDRLRRVFGEYRE
jgi:methylmalonyl-CoA mutase N-terminal domain/subunit